MRKIHQFSVHPEIPERLAGLQELAYNLRWVWDRRTFKVFQHLDPELFDKCSHNPVLLLRRVSKERLEDAAADAAFLAHMDGALADLRRYMSEPGWFRIKYPEHKDLRIAYFCMEFGLTACLPIYSGGLGVLAGDHLKSASGLDLPLVGVGLLYHKGYFVQHLDEDGWQHESYRMLDFGTLPVRPVAAGAPGAAGPDGMSAAPLSDDAPGGMGDTPLRVSVDIGERMVWARVWRAQVGRIPLFLLDTDLHENDPRDRRITSELYGGGSEERLSQELILGVGGMRALRALGIEPQMCHLNEGHTVFAGLERTRDHMHRYGLSYREARQAVGAGTLFTTHTPVPAGFDLFPRTLIDHQLSAYLEEMDLTLPEFMRMGSPTSDKNSEEFNVAALALRQSPRRNAVSRLHRRVTARMMQPGWVDFPRGDMPIESVTNGVHTNSWVAPEMERLFDHYLGPRWGEDASSPDSWQGVERIPDLELWRSHTRLRERLVAYAREQAELQARERLSGGALGSLGDSANGGLPLVGAPPLRSDALTIGFARRFATYKRATLLFRDVARLKAILTDESRPVQLVVAGKAHPRDGAGKDFIREMLEVVRRENLGDRVVFVEDYDLRKAAMLVQGVDVWLNNPRRPYEASGTSGMKVVPNGGLNISVLDGWWAEAYRPGMGWAIGNGQEFAHHEYQDQLDAESLYNILEKEVIPTFYERDVDGIPRKWIAMMKESIRHLAPAFSGDRMVKQYAERYYIPGGEHYKRMAGDDFAKAREFAAWKERVRAAWPYVEVSWVEERGVPDVPVGEGIPVTAKVKLGPLDPEEVTVQAFYSRLRPDGALANGRGIDLCWLTFENGEHVYQGIVPSKTSGLHGYAVRVLPRHNDVLVPNELPLIAWEES